MEEKWISQKATFPYIPGLLSFREGPVLLKAFERLSIEPDVILFDGHGIAHPRGIGIASHLGILLNKASVGIAKKVLIGNYKIPPVKKGASTFLKHKGKIIGKVLRTRDNVKPLLVSPGHLINLMSAEKITLATCLKYRLPEPIRHAHLLSKSLLEAIE